MPLYAGKHAICAFLRNMRNMLRSHVRYKPVSLINVTYIDFIILFCELVNGNIHVLLYTVYYSCVWSCK